MNIEFEFEHENLALNHQINFGSFFINLNSYEYSSKCCNHTYIFMKFPPFPFTSSCFLHSASYNENSCLLERKRFFKVRSIKWIPLHVVKPSHSSVVSMFKWHLIKGGGMKTRSFSLPDKNSRLHVRFMIVNSSPARPVCITLIFKAKKWYVKQIFTLRCQSISRHNVEGVFLSTPCH